MVTITSALAVQNAPSLVSAIATTFCASASLMRVAILATPFLGRKVALKTCGCGFFSLKTWIALTKSASLIGLSTETVIGTVLPFSTSGGRSSVTLPSRIGAPFTTSWIAAAIASGVACAGPSGTSVIGDAVNLGARLESLNKDYGTRIIISEATRSALKGRYDIHPLGDVVVKGKSTPVAIFEVRPT